MLLVPLLWVVATSAPLVEPLTAQATPIPLFILDSNGNGRPEVAGASLQFRAGSDGMAGLTFDPTTEKVGFVTPFDSCHVDSTGTGRTSDWDPVEFSGSRTYLTARGARVGFTTATRANFITGELFTLTEILDPLAPNGVVYGYNLTRLVNMGLAMAGTGDGYYKKNANGDVTGIFITGQIGRAGRATPYELDTDLVTTCPGLADGSCYQSIPFAPFAAAGGGVTNDSPCAAGLGSMSQVFINTHPDKGIEWRDVNGAPIDNVFAPQPLTNNGSTTVPVSFGLIGDGSGTVTGTFAGNPNAINCGSQCTNNTSRFGESWTFNAIPNPGSVFAGYSDGSGIGRNPECEHANSNFALDLLGETKCFAKFNEGTTPPGGGGGVPQNFMATGQGNYKILLMWTPDPQNLATEVRYHDTDIAAVANLPFPGGPRILLTVGQAQAGKLELFVPLVHQPFAASHGTPPGTWIFAAFNSNGLSAPDTATTGLAADPNPIVGMVTTQ